MDTSATPLSTRRCSSRYRRATGYPRTLVHTRLVCSLLLLPLCLHLRQRCISCFIQPLMLIFQFCPQLVHLGFNQSKSNRGFLDNLMILFLRSTRNEYSGSRDAGQRLSSTAYSLDRRGNLVLRCVLHGYLTRFPMGASFLRGTFNASAHCCKRGVSYPAERSK